MYDMLLLAYHKLNVHIKKNTVDSCYMSGLIEPNCHIYNEDLCPFI